MKWNTQLFNDVQEGLAVNYCRLEAELLKKV